MLSKLRFYLKTCYLNNLFIWAAAFFITLTLISMDFFRFKTQTNNLDLYSTSFQSQTKGGLFKKQTFKLIVNF